MVTRQIEILRIKGKTVFGGYKVQVLTEFQIPDFNYIFCYDDFLSVSLCRFFITSKVWKKKNKSCVNELKQEHWPLPHTHTPNPTRLHKNIQVSGKKRIMLRPKLSLLCLLLSNCKTLEKNHGNIPNFVFAIFEALGLWSVMEIWQCLQNTRHHEKHKCCVFAKRHIFSHVISRDLYLYLSFAVTLKFSPFNSLQFVVNINFLLQGK
jgi:hypothetical protein